MQYSFISAAILALTSSVFAQTADFDAITSPTKDQQVAAGSSLDIIWQPGTYTTGTATIQLLQGADPATLSPGVIVKAGIENSAGKFTWAVPSDLGSFATYGFTITLDGSNPVVFQYSNPFHITSLSSSAGTPSPSVASSGTVTVHLETGSAYTPKPTITASANTTIIAPTSSMNVTVSHSTPYPSSNVTLSTSISSSKPTMTSGSSSATGSAPAQQSTNAGMTNAASGGLALIGGLVLALAL